jgi:hypothetical protein
MLLDHVLTSSKGILTPSEIEWWGGTMTSS